MSNAARDAAIAKLAKAQSSQYGMFVGAVSSEDKIIQVPTRTTGIPDLDLALGGGGIPMGGIVEIYGEESSGKTTIALSAISAMHEEDPEALAVFVDVEHALNIDLVRAMNVDEDRLIIAQPESAPVALQIAREWINSGLAGIVVLDSTAALVLEGDLQKDSGENDKVAGRASLMSSELPKWLHGMKDSATSVILLSQMRTMFYAHGAAGLQSTGGKSTKFYAMQRIKIRAPKGDLIKSGKTVIGSKVTGLVEKNKLGAPYREATWNILYGKGIDEIDGCFTLARHFGIIGKEKDTATKFFLYYEGSDLKLNKTELAVGLQKAREALQSDPKLLESVKASIKAANKARGNNMKSLIGAEKALPNPDIDGEIACANFQAELRGEEITEGEKGMLTDLLGEQDGPISSESEDEEAAF